MNRPEQNLHRAIADYLDIALPPDCWWTTIPLGGGGRLRGAFLKTMGAKKGTPDILIVRAGRAYWIELKSQHGCVSPAQRECAMRLRTAGCPVPMVCRSIDDVAAVLASFGIELRAKVAA